MKDRNESLSLKKSDTLSFMTYSYSDSIWKQKDGRGKQRQTKKESALLLDEIEFKIKASNVCATKG